VGLRWAAGGRHHSVIDSPPGSGRKGGAGRQAGGGERAWGSIGPCVIGVSVPHDGVRCVRGSGSGVLIQYSPCDGARCEMALSYIEF
jgi:hypothetical protein